MGFVIGTHDLIQPFPQRLPLSPAHFPNAPPERKMYKNMRHPLYSTSVPNAHSITTTLLTVPVIHPTSASRGHFPVFSKPHHVSRGGLCTAVRDISTSPMPLGPCYRARHTQMGCPCSLTRITATQRRVAFGTNLQRRLRRRKRVRSCCLRSSNVYWTTRGSTKSAGVR